MADEAVLGTGGLALFASILGGLEARFDCPDFHVSGTLESLGASKELLLFLDCKEEKPKGCKLSLEDEKEINAEYSARQETVGLALLTGSRTSEAFTGLQIENKLGETCASTGSFSVKGRQMVETSTGAGLTQTITAKKSESFLKFGTEKASEKASFSGVSQIHLSGIDKDLDWLVMSGE